MKTILIACALCGILVALQTGWGQEAGPAAATKRVWTDGTGLHKVEAEFLRVVGPNVQLRKTDGKVISLALERLSLADQDVVRELAKAAPVRPMAPAPAEATTPMTAGKATPTKRSAAAPPSGPAKVVATPQAQTMVRNRVPDNPTLDFSSVTEFKPLPPDPSPYAALPLLPKFSFPRLSKSEEVTGVAIDEAAGLAWMSVKETDFNIPTRLDRVHLATGKLLEPLPLLGKQIVMAVDGQYVLNRLSTGEGVDTQYNSAAIWRVEKNTLTLVNHLAPLDHVLNDLQQQNGIASMHLAQGATAVFQSRNGVVLWNITDRKPIARTPRFPYGMCCAVSPGRKYVAIACPEGCFLIEPATARILSRLQLPEGDKCSFESMAFSEDGKLLGINNRTTLWIMDLTNGSCLKHLKNLELQSPQSYMEAFCFTADGMVMFNHSQLYDYEREQLLCTFQQGYAVHSYRGREVYVCEDVQGGQVIRTLRAIKHPEEKILQAAANGPVRATYTKDGTTLD